MRKGTNAIAKGNQWTGLGVGLDGRGGGLDGVDGVDGCEEALAWKWWSRALPFGIYPLVRSMKDAMPQCDSL